MSVLVPSLPSSTNSHHHYFSNQHINGRPKSITNRLASKIPDNNQGSTDNDQVPCGVVNSMKQRLLNKVNESLSSSNRLSTLKSSIRVSSNENLLQTKSSTSPLKHTTRLSRSQENLLNSTNEQISSYLQPRQNVIIVERTKSTDDSAAAFRHSYIEMNIDEVPKPGTVTTVKNMFERQIRLSRYDTHRLPSTSTSNNSRTNSQHRDFSSRSRSRSVSPNDLAVRQRRVASVVQATVLSSTPLSIPMSTSYPDLVISHTPPAEPTKIISSDSPVINGFSDNKKKNMPLNIVTMETPINNMNYDRPNLLLSASASSDNLDYQPLDFKSRLALFNRTSTIERSNGHTQYQIISKKSQNNASTNPVVPNLITKPIVFHHETDKMEIPSEPNDTSLTKSVTFFGGEKLNTNIQATLPDSIIILPPPLSPSIVKDEQSSLSATIDILRAPDIIGGNVKLNKSSIYSGTKKDVRVQFVDDVDTYEYPSLHVALAEYGDTDTDDSNDESICKDDNNTIDKFDAIPNNKVDDVDDDELELLASINAKYNSNNTIENAPQPKGTLHTFRPSYLDQYQLGTQHDSMTNSTMSDKFTREKYLSNHSTLKQEKSMHDMTNNVQWSSMSTTTDLLF